MPLLCAAVILQTIPQNNAYGIFLSKTLQNHTTNNAFLFVLAIGFRRIQQNKFSRFSGVCEARAPHACFQRVSKKPETRERQLFFDASENQRPEKTEKGLLFVLF